MHTVFNFEPADIYVTLEHSFFFLKFDKKFIFLVKKECQVDFIRKEKFWQ